ncbi:MAG: glycosyltransferase [bacterium]
MIVGLVAPLPPLRGGITHFDVLLLEGLRNSGHTVVPISYRKLYPSFLFPGSSQYDEGQPLAPDTLPILVAWNPITWMRALRALKRAGVESLVLIHWHPFFALCLRFLATLRPRNGVALYVHNAMPHESAWMGRLFNPVLYRAVDRLFTGSDTEADVLRRIAPSVPVQTLLHPVHDRFRNIFSEMSQDEARLKLGITGDRPCLMHLGLVRRYKGVDILLEAIGRLPRGRVRLRIAGEFYDDKADYEQLIDGLGLRDEVTLIDRYLSDEEMALHLIAADAIVLPYRNATQSGVAMIALSMGTPVIASRVGQLAQVIVRPEYGELVEPENAQALAEAVERFLQRKKRGDPKLRQRIRDLVEEQFGHWERFANRMLTPQGEEG